MVRSACTSVATDGGGIGGGMGVQTVVNTTVVIIFLTFIMVGNSTLDNVAGVFSNFKKASRASGSGGFR